jgi:hypothetical protein
MRPKIRCSSERSGSVWAPATLLLKQVQQAASGDAGTCCKFRCKSSKTGASSLPVTAFAVLYSGRAQSGKG